MSKKTPDKSARNLGIIFDKKFTFRSHISVVCNSSFYHIWDLLRIRRQLELNSAKLLATALVCSHLDYCNSLLYGIADIDTIRLQRVQNQLARLMTMSPIFTCSIPLLRSLHWLTVRFRKPVKINLLTYKTQTMLIVCQSLASRPILVLQLFTLVPHLFGTTSRCLSVQPVQLVRSRNI